MGEEQSIHRRKMKPSGDGTTPGKAAEHSAIDEPGSARVVFERQQRLLRLRLPQSATMFGVSKTILGSSSLTGPGVMLF